MRRAPGQTLVNLPMKIAFRDFIDDNLGNLGYDDRAKFIRAAVWEKLTAMGKVIPRDLMLSPGRQGKGGKGKTLSRMPIPMAARSNLRRPSEDEEILFEAEKQEPNPPPKYKRKR